MKRRWLLLLAILAGCAAVAPYRRARQAKLALRAVEWNPSGGVAVGRVLAVADDGDATLLAGDAGVVAIKAGVATAVDKRKLVAAATIPAADGSGSWLAATDESGRLYRLRGSSALEEIDQRYGLHESTIRALCSPGGGSVAMQLADGIAIADGKTVTRYPIVVEELACGPGRVAGRDRQLVVALEVGHGTVRRFAVRAVAIAVDGRGRVVVATRQALFVENADGLALRYVADARIGGLAGGGGRVWLDDGGAIGLLEGDRVAIAAASSLAPGARLVASSSGDLWALGDGTPSRFARAGNRDDPAERWAVSIAPLFARVCADCHLPRGRAGIDLSTVEAWTSERDEVRKRVLVERTMPPAGHTLSESERQQIRDWLDAKK